MSAMEYRIVGIIDGAEHTIDTLGCWGPKQDYLPTSEQRLERAKKKLDEYRKYRRILSSVRGITRPEDIWIEGREVGKWRKTADGGTVSESYIRTAEEGSVCPAPRASVIFEGQKLTFDAEDSKQFARLLDRHLRKLAGVGVDE